MMAVSLELNRLVRLIRCLANISVKLTSVSIMFRAFLFPMAIFSIITTVPIAIFVATSPVSIIRVVIRFVSSWAFPANKLVN